MDPFTPKDGYGQVLYAGLGRPKVIRLDEHRVLKRAYTERREPDTMELILANTTIPVPRVYTTRFSNDLTNSENVMEYLPGESLDKVWGGLTHEQRISTCHQLSGYLAQLRSLQGAGNRVEGVNGAPITVGLRFPRQGGPFNTEKEFNDFVVEKDNEIIPPFFKRYARAGLRDDHKIHFAHGDFSPRNILVDKEGCVTGVLDWDRSGFYLEYWDQNRMLTENPGIKDWFPYLEHILAFDYTQEVLALGYLTRIMGDG